jgi:hypothetical protein
MVLMTQTKDSKETGGIRHKGNIVFLFFTYNCLNSRLLFLIEPLNPYVESKVGLCLVYFGVFSFVWPLARAKPWKKSNFNIKLRLIRICIRIGWLMAAADERQIAPYGFQSNCFDSRIM